MAQRSSVRRLLVRVAAGLLMVVLLLLAGGAFAVWKTLQRASEDRAASLARRREAFLEAQRELAALPLFRPRSGGDATRVLAPRIHWHTARRPGSPDASQPPAERWLARLPDAERHLALDPALASRVLREGWVDVDPAFTDAVDFGWMARLAGLGGFSVDAVSPDGTHDLHALTSVPDYFDLTAWGRLRLLAGRRTGTLDRAVADVDELARVLAASDDETIVIHAFGMLREIELVLERAGSPLLASRPRADWERFRSAQEAASAWTRLDAPPAFDADWSQLRVGRCAALRDRLGQALQARPFLASSRREAYQRLGRLLEAAPECSLPSLRAEWAAPDPADPGERFAPRDRWIETWVGRFLPRVAGELLLSLR